MCSHEEITWKVVHNNIAHRMIDSSLTHRFLSPRKIRKRTKLMNAEIKKRVIIKDYDEYMALRNSIIQKVPVDYDTDNTDNLSDVDYSIIYNSKSKLRQYRIKHSTSRICIRDKDEKMNQVKRIKKNSVTKPIKKKKSIDIRQQKDSTSQEYSSDNEDDDKDEESQTIKMTKKSGKTKPMKDNTKKFVNTRQENFISQALYTSDESDDEQESQLIYKTRHSKAKSVKRNTKKSVNIKQQENFISRELDINDENDNEKESQMIWKTKKNSKAKSTKKQIKKSVNIGWQEVIKKNINTTLVFDNEQCTDTSNISKHNIPYSDKCDSPKVASNKRSLSPKLDSQDDMAPCTTNSVNEDIPQNHNNPVTVIPESNSLSNYESDYQNRCTTRNHEDSEALTDKTNPESIGHVNDVVWKTNPEEKVVINKDDVIQEESVITANVLDYSRSLQISPKDEMHKSKLATLKIESLPINDPPLSASKKQPSVSKDHNYEKPVKVEEKSPMNVKNYNDAFMSPKSSKLINNVKRNLASMLDSVDSKHQVSSPDTSHDQHKDSGIEEDSQDAFVKRVNTGNQNNVENTVEKISVPSEPVQADKVAEEMQEDCIKDTSLKVDEEILKEQDTADDTEMKEPETDFPKLNQTEEKNAEVISEAKTLEDSCNVQKKQLQPKVMSTEIISQKYKIICKKDDDINVTCEEADCNPSELDASTSSNVITDDVDDTSTKMINEIPVAQELEHEEDEEDDANMACCVSPQTKKRLQRLNLTENSDSSDSGNENGYRSIVDRNSKSHTDNFSNEKDETSRKNIPEEIDTELENDKKNSVIEVNEAEISRSEDTREDVRGIDISYVKDNVNRRKRPRNDERSYISGKKHNRSASWNGKNVDSEDDQCQENMRYRPCNLEELIEDEELIVETLPTSFTLADISENEEAFILNIPDKVLQCNLQNQSLVLKGKTIKFGKSKFRVVQNKMSTVSCVFATSKQRKPYKIVNLKEISTITVGERLSHPTKDSAKSNSHDVNISSKKKSRRKRYTSK